MSGVVSRGSVYTQASVGSSNTMAAVGRGGHTRGGAMAGNNRPGTSHGRPRTGLPPTAIRCNRCRKPLETTVYICSCDCAFCEACTYSHFENNSNCPVCQKTLQQDDFLDVIVSAPTAENHVKSSFQNMFTRCSTSSNPITLHEMSYRSLKALEGQVRMHRFWTKQTLHECNMANSQLGGAMRQMAKMKEDSVKLQQAIGTERINFQTEIKDLQLKLQASATTIKELQKANHEKDKQIQQFREMYTSGGGGRGAPGTSYSNRSGTSGGGGGGTGPPQQHHQQQQHHHQQQHPMGESTGHFNHHGGGGASVNSGSQQGFARRQPVPSFIQLQQQSSSSSGQARGESSRPPNNSFLGLPSPSSGHGSGGLLPSRGGGGGGGLMMGRASSDLDSIATPIIPPPHHHLNGRSGSSNGSGGDSRLHHFNSPHQGGGGGTPQGMAYTFSTQSNNKRARSSSSPGLPGAFSFPGSGGSGRMPSFPRR